MPGQSAWAAPYAAIVMDMRDGKVMHARSADRRQHPASLTKMMTLYLAFEAVENGQISLNQKVRISRKAARMTGSRLRLRSGQRVSVRDLIRATAIKSANDAAMALAETIGGSEKRFAEMMTAKARLLGMPNTTYKNPHGLTRKGHLTTARDQALLARHLYFDFPQYYNIFGRKSSFAAGKRIWTTNRLLGTYRGMEGMKTGFTRAAGYNLVGIANRGQERVIAVVMGGKSSRTRNRRMAQLLDMGFSRAPSRVAIKRPSRAGVEVARAPLPAPKPGTPATGLAALAEALSPATASASTPRYTSPFAPQFAEAPEPKRGAWSIVAGSYTDEAGAVARLASIAARGIDLTGSRSVIAKRRANGRTLYDVRFSGLSQTRARAVCRELGKLCNPVAPR
ncbi:MAG: D-alanyl-D-alanine carboxypeptidase [Pseudomonadota bacterium]